MPYFYKIHFNIILSSPAKLFLNFSFQSNSKKNKAPNIDPLDFYSVEGNEFIPTFRKILTFKSLAVSLRNTRFNIQNFYMVLALR
jgi:hypothetical protein